MRIEENRLYAVVTGDVIASSKLSTASRRTLHEAMTATSTNLLEAFREDLLAEVDIFGGDSWQIVLTTPVPALRAALFYRAGLRARMRSHQFDVRMALAIGTIDFIPGDRVSQGNGEAFQLSGRTIKAMSKGANMRLRFPNRPEEGVLDVVVQLVDSLAARWSDKQALAITGALRGWKQDRIAKSCWDRPISQQAVAQHLDRAAWSSIEVGLRFCEETLRSIVEEKQAK